MRLIFLDRDGVINKFPGKGVYVVQENAFIFLPKALQAIKLLTQAGFRLVIVSNQGCVARGLITKAALRRLTQGMLKKIKDAGGKIHKVYYCLHRKSDGCRCKKPKTYFFEKAMKPLGVKRSTVYFIGDSEEDVTAGHAIGCQSVLVLSGRSTKKDAKKFPKKPHAIKKDLWEAAQWILQKKS